MKKSRLMQFMFVCLVCLSANVFAITQEAIYTGPSGGNWNTASNWNINVVPINQGVLTFNVTIPAGNKVVVDVKGDSAINNFTLGDNTSNDAELELIIKDSVKCNLTVLGTANIYDYIYGNGGHFTATATADSLKGNRNRIWAENGSHISINDTTFDSSGLNDGHYTLLSADGAGSVLDLSGLTSLDDGFVIDHDYVHTIKAVNGGSINLSSLTSIIGPADTETLSIELLISP